MVKQKAITTPRAKHKTKDQEPVEFDAMVEELELICDVSFNKRYNLFVDRHPFEVRLCSVDSTNILAYFTRDHTTRDCEYLSQSSLMQDLITTSECPKVTTFIKRYG
tara:strand:- start:625 stop:945 length:321 start_codon:yes stop_codon:yes gene_type:complete